MMRARISVVAASNIRFLVLIGNPNTNEENDGIWGSTWKDYSEKERQLGTT